MADSIARERLLPCLLDRLTDASPRDKAEGRDERVQFLRQYREGVLRDLAWLLNTSAPLPSEGLDDFPEVAASVLNYGVRNLAGASSSGLGPSALERQIREAVERFEPRILRGTLEIKARVGSDRTELDSVGFEIRGEIWAQPVPENLYVRTEIDLGTGHVAVKDSPNG